MTWPQSTKVQSSCSGLHSSVSIGHNVNYRWSPWPRTSSCSRMFRSIRQGAQVLLLSVRCRFLGCSLSASPSVDELDQIGSVHPQQMHPCLGLFVEGWLGGTATIGFLVSRPHPAFMLSSIPGWFLFGLPFRASQPRPPRRMGVHHRKMYVALPYSQVPAVSHPGPVPGSLCDRLIGTYCPVPSPSCSSTLTVAVR